jgi:carboxymethylenebutenolidase
MRLKASIIIFIALLIVTPLISCAGMSAPGLFTPQTGKGRVVLMLSGQSGPTLYEEFAQRLADAGYYVMLYDGKDFPLYNPESLRGKINEIMSEASMSPFALPGKAVIIGYSLGGAVALTYAAGNAEHISGIIVYYPGSSLITDQSTYESNFLVPVTAFQGEDDRYFNCCLVERIRALSLTAREKGKDFELIVYPEAGHGFNLGPMKNKELDADSWRKTTDALKKYLR